MNKFSLSILSIIVIFAIGINSAKYFPDHKLHILICDVGQGDGILIYTPQGKTVLVDAGPDDKIQHCLSQKKPFWDHTIEIGIVSHFHADHITGFINLFKSYHFNSLIRNELNYTSPEKQQYEKESLQQTKDIQQAWKGDLIEIEQDLTLQVFWPNKTAWNRTNGNWEAYLSDFNDSSFVLLLSYKNAEVLLTGDAGTGILDLVAQESLFARAIRNAKVRIYKVSHHGSRDANSQNLLTVFQPQIAVISLGKKNTFGHPHEETIKTLKSNHIPSLRTDQQGTIEFITDGETLTIGTEK